MASIILDADLERKLIEERRARGADRFDEVWDGTYIMSPLADNEHQRLVARLTTALVQVIEESRLGSVYPGCNVTDQPTDWTKNYRVPDVAVFLNGTHAVDRQSYWFGGPDLAIEIVSEGDRSRDKFDFYASIVTREVLVIDRDPWQLELYRLQSGLLRMVGTNKPGDSQPIISEVAGLSFALEESHGETQRPRLKMVQLETGSTWTY
jgi:Uma2 family endonuclease